MSAKKRKGSSAWYECDYCHVIINQKYGILHKEKSCPPNLEAWVHPFIYNYSLYSTLDNIKSLESISQHFSKESKADFVFLPLQVLQMCRIPVGDPVVVTPKQSKVVTPFVKQAWPLPEGPTDFTTALTHEGRTVMTLYDLEPQTQVVVSRLQEEIRIAIKVILYDENSTEFKLDVKDLMQRLKQQNLNKIIRINNKLCVKYYGRKMEFLVEEIKPMEGVSDVDQECYFVITPDTMLVTNQSVIEKEQKRNLIDKLGGLNEVIEEIKYIISFVMEQKNILTNLHVARGILIHGPMGTGKTTLIEALAEYFTTNIVRIECTKIFSKVIGETEKELQSSFYRAIQFGQSIILIDDLDVLCAKLSSDLEYKSRIVATLMVLMDKVNINDGSQVVVLATTSKIHLIDNALRSATRFGKEVEIYVPSSLQRFEILRILLQEVKHNLTETDIKNIAESCHGFVGADLSSLMSKALLKNYKTTRGDENVSVNDFEWALTKVKPSAMKEIMVEIPDVRWEDIGGQDELKLKLKQSVEWPLKYKDSFNRLGITPPKGLLMFGPPGCSKTMIAKALATESKLNFISVKAPELFSKWVGESEKAVQKVFRRARQTAPSIVFFDELDAIGGERNMSSSSSVQERVLAQMLIEMDGVEPLENVTVIAATNRPDRIDSALLRPGRLDRIVYVPLPDEKTRQEIFDIQLKKTCIDESVVPSELVERTRGYSGAEIVAVCREAALKALEENLEAKNVTRQHFLEALKIVIPRTSKTLLDIYEKYSKMQ